MACERCKRVLAGRDEMFGTLGIVNGVLTNYPAVCRACWTKMWGDPFPPSLPAWRPEQTGVVEI